jgi:glycosyltransferase involved in cell wall biosynthesis
MVKTGKHIWYVSHYVAPPEYDTHLRVIKFAQELQKAGHEVTIFTSSFLHYKNLELLPGREKYVERSYDNLNYVHIKSGSYKKHGLKRIFSLFFFIIRLFLLRRKFKKPDCIIHSAQVPFQNMMPLVAWSLRAKYFVEVLDLYPESFAAYGLVSRNNPFLKMAYLMEKRLYARADRLIFSMEGGIEYLREKAWDKEHGGPIDLEKVLYINNGVDLAEFDLNRSSHTIDDQDLTSPETFKVIYLGSIRLANNLKQLIDAAALLKEEKRIVFLIYGDGAEREYLEGYCRQNEISNVHFKQRWVDIKYVPFIVSQSSLNIINHMPTNILKYGGSQGKLFQYLAGGKPICSNIKMGYCLISKYKLGIARNFSSAEEYAKSILGVANADEKEYREMCKRVRSVAEQFDYVVLSKKLIHAIDSVD